MTSHELARLLLKGPDKPVQFAPVMGNHKGLVKYAPTPITQVCTYKDTDVFLIDDLNEEIRNDMMPHFVDPAKTLQP